jgi:RNA polymerase sigma-70 factor (ECF subfamily)
MPTPNATVVIDFESLDDAALVGLARDGQRGAFRHIMQRCNQRLFRVARSVLRNDFEAEDVVQEAYARAFGSLATFRGEASLLTWLTRIVLNEAHGRIRKRRNLVDIDQVESSDARDDRVIPVPSKFGGEDPAASAARAEVRRLLEHAIDELPESFRLVFTLRELEGCTVEETAANLGIREETVKTRLFRARRLLRAALEGSLASSLSGAFPFLGRRCARMTEQVLARLPVPSAPDAVSGLPEG